MMSLTFYEDNQLDIAYEKLNDMVSAFGCSIDAMAQSFQCMIASGKTFSDAWDQFNEQIKPIETLVTKPTNRQEAFGNLFRKKGQRWI
jgi:uncharacterized protein YukE